MEAKLVAGIVVAVIVIAAIGGVAVWMTKPSAKPPTTQTPTPAVTKPTPTPPTVPTATPAATVKPTPTPVTQLSCDMCHNRERTANLEAHTKGGYMVNGKPGCFDYENLGGCHGGPNATVHTVHAGVVACTQCHGSPEPHIPQKGPGNTTCEQCHGYPNALEPYMNLVDIHLKRGKPCTVCHRGEISEIHGMK